MDTNTKGSCFAAHDNNEKFPPLDALKRLKCLVMDLKDIVIIQLDFGRKYVDLFYLSLSGWTYLYYNFTAFKYIF